MISGIFGTAQFGSDQFGTAVPDSPALSFVCDIAGLADGAARSSAAIDNTTTSYGDVLVQVSIKTGSGVSATGWVGIYVYGSADGGSTYGDGATGADAAITLSDPANVRLIGLVYANADSTSFSSSPMSVATALGSALPAQWGIIVQNNTGAALDGNEENHLLFYQGFLGL